MLLCLQCGGRRKMYRSNSGCVLLMYLFLINSISFVHVVSCGAEARTLTKKEDQAVLIF